MKKKVIATKPLSREKTLSKPKLNANIFNLKPKEVKSNAKLQNNYMKSGSNLINIHKVNVNKDGKIIQSLQSNNNLGSCSNRAVDSNSGRNAVQNKPGNMVNTVNSINSGVGSEDNIRAYENVISKMFKYLKEKVPQDVYEEMKHVLTDELNKSQNNNVNPKNDSNSSAQDVINLVTKNSRNNKRIDEKVTDSLKMNERKNVRDGTTTGTNTNSNISNNSNAKNLKLSFDFSKPTSNSRTRTGMNNREGNLVTAATTTNSKSKLITTKDQNPGANSHLINLMNLNNKNIHQNQTGNISNLNLKGYLNFSNNLHQNFQQEQRNIIQKSNDNIILPSNTSHNQKNRGLFNVIKVGNVTNISSSVGKNLKNLLGKSKTQSNSKSKSKESRPVMASLSQSKSKSKSKLGLKKEIVNLEGLRSGIELISTPSNSGAHVKLNTNLTRKTGISPENYRPHHGVINTLIESYNQNKFKVNKNINLSSSNFDNANKKNISIQQGKSQKKGNIINNIKSGEISILNAKPNQSLQTTSPFQKITPTNLHVNPQKEKTQMLKKNIIHQIHPHNQTTLQNTCYTATGRDTYISNNTNHSLNLNESKKIISNPSKRIMDLTYNISSKDKESARLSNREGSLIRNNTSYKYVDLHDIGVINSEATIQSSNQKTTQNDLIEIKGEKPMKKEDLNLELIHEIKMNLDDNLKNMFNFSYEYFHKEQSESGHSTKKSVEVDISDHENDINIQDDYQPDLYHNEKNSNQISFDEHENRIKDQLFTKKK